MCEGFGGFVPRLQNQMALTFARATHNALNEFTSSLPGDSTGEYADCYGTGSTAAHARICPVKHKRDDRSVCHIGCSAHPPTRCH